MSSKLLSEVSQGSLQPFSVGDFARAYGFKSLASQEYCKCLLVPGVL